MSLEKCQVFQETIHIAASRGDIQSVREYLQQGGYVDAKNFEGYTPLAYAAIKNQREIAEILLKNGADVLAESKDGHTPLYLSAVFRAKEVASLLLTYGAPPELASAALIGDVIFFEDYLRRGNDINCCKGTIPLEQVINLSGNQELVKFLLKNGADVNAQTNPYGWSALHSSAARGYITICKILIENGAQTNIKDKNGETPLHHAVKNGHQNTVELLIANGADVNGVGNFGVPLYYAIEGAFPNIVKILIQHGSSVNEKNLKDTNKGTLLHLAVYKNDLEIVQLLLKNQAEVNINSGFWGYTPLYYAQSKQMGDLLRHFGLHSRMYKWAEIWHFIREILYTLSASG